MSWHSTPTIYRIFCVNGLSTT